MFWTIIAKQLQMVFYYETTEFLKSKEKLCPVSLDVNLLPEVKQDCPCKKDSRSMVNVGGWMRFKLYP